MSQLDILTVGMVVVDHFAVDLQELPAPGKTQFTTQPIEERTGGHPHNVAVDLVKLGMDGSSIGVISAIGNDSAGALMEKALREHGIRSFLKKVTMSTGQGLQLVPRGYDRITILGPGANLELDAVYVKSVLVEQNPRVLSIRPGYSGIDDNVASLMKSAQAQGTYVLLDVIKPYGREWSYFRSALPYANALHCNDMEAMNITGADTVDAAREVFLSHGVKLVAITNGEEGASLATSHEQVEQPAFTVDAIDPTGCGDAFCAGLLKKLLEWEMPEPSALDRAKLEELLRYGQAVGAAAATAPGCTSGVSRNLIAQLLREQGN